MKSLFGSITNALRHRRRCPQSPYAPTTIESLEARQLLTSSPSLLNIAYVGGGGDDWIGDIAADHAGGAYIVGDTSTQDWISGGFDTTAVASNNMRGYLAHLDSTGNVLWSSFVPFTNEARLGTDAQDNVIFATGTGEVFKVSSAGQLLWHAQIPSTRSLTIHGLDVDAAGNSIVVGAVSTPGTYDFDTLFAKINSSGQLVWSHEIGNVFFDDALAVAIDPAGGAYATVSISQGPIAGGTGTPSTTPELFDPHFQNTGLYLFKINDDGQIQWNSAIHGIEDPIALALDNSGNIIVGGSHTVEKISPNLNVLWSNSLPMQVRDLAVDSFGRIAVVGDLQQQANLEGGFDLTFNGGSNDGAVAQLSSSGQTLWSSYVGADDTEYTLSTDIDPLGQILIGGQTGASPISSGDITPPQERGIKDSFVATIKPPITASAPVAISGLPIRLTVDGDVQALQIYHDYNLNGIIDSSELLVGTDDSPSDGWSFSTQLLTAGDHALLVRARVDADTWIELNPIPLTIRNAMPYSYRSSFTPAITPRISVSQRLRLHLDEQIGIDEVELYNDVNGDGLIEVGTDALLGTDATADGWIFRDAPQMLGPGSHSLLAFAHLSTSDQWLYTGPIPITIRDDRNADLVQGGLAPFSTRKRIQLDFPSYNIAEAELYLDSNGDHAIEPDADLLLGSDSTPADGFTFPSLAKFVPAGSYKLIAQVRDTQDLWHPVTPQFTVTIRPLPVVASFKAEQVAPLIKGHAAYRLTALPGINDGGVKFEFYLDSNNNGRLDLGQDHLLGRDSNVIGGWSISNQQTRFSAGRHLLFARLFNGEAYATGSVSINVPKPAAHKPPKPPKAPDCFQGRCN